SPLECDGSRAARGRQCPIHGSLDRRRVLSGRPRKALPAQLEHGIISSSSSNPCSTKSKLA
ncbi:hypothetical protein, partial [Klebsiella pneumoniae]|uniref:hypothetical protein n=1 Tax=Klebsiella pneumoniae TaxID=573 RepID=UPI003D6B0378